MDHGCHGFQSRLAGRRDGAGAVTGPGAEYPMWQLDFLRTTGRSEKNDTCIKKGAFNGNCVCVCECIIYIQLYTWIWGLSHVFFLLNIAVEYHHVDRTKQVIVHSYVELPEVGMILQGT